MRKILLIEDVLIRQRDFMRERSFTLEEYSSILENAIGDKYKKIALELKNDTFNFDEYSMIMVHQSAFEDDVAILIDRIKKYCEKHKKALVLFSGGSSSYYNNTQYESLELNTKNFYSDNLKLFLDAYKNNNENILMLGYGNKWIISVLLNVLEKTNLFLEQNSGNDEGYIVYGEFENFTEINKIENVKYDFYEVAIEDDWVHKEELVKLRDSILECIEEMSLLV